MHTFRSAAWIVILVAGCVTPAMQAADKTGFLDFGLTFNLQVDDDRVANDGYGFSAAYRYNLNKFIGGLSAGMRVAIKTFDLDTDKTPSARDETFTDVPILLVARLTGSSPSSFLSLHVEVGFGYSINFTSGDMSKSVSSGGIDLDVEHSFAAYAQAGLTFQLIETFAVGGIVEYFWSQVDFDASTGADRFDISHFGLGATAILSF